MPNDVYMKVDGILFKDDPRYAIMKSMIDQITKEKLNLEFELLEAERENARLRQLLKKRKG